jgi:outer membrane protein assembly factor BamB
MYLTYNLLRKYRTNGLTMQKNPSRNRIMRGLIPVTLFGMGILLAPALANDWPELRGDATRRGVSSEKVVPPLSLLWRYSAGQQSQNLCAPTIVGDTVYYSTRANSDANSGGVLFALDVRTGQKRWQYPRESAGNGLRDRHLFLTAPLVHEGRVYVGASDGSLYVLDAESGEYVLQFKTGRAINSAPTIADGVLLFGSNDGTLYALDPKTGEPVWKSLYRPGDSVNSAPIVAAGYIFVTTTDNSVHAVLEKTGIPRWKNRLNYRILPNSAIYSDSTLLVASGPQLTALQPTSGLTRWQQRLPLDILAAPTADNGIVYVACRDAQGSGALLYAFRTNNGRPEWDKPAPLPLPPSAPPTISGDVIYIPTVRNVLLAVSKTDGKVLWEYYVEPSSNRPRDPNANARTSTVVTSPVSIANGTVYALTDDGALSAFRPDAPDTSGPMFSQLYPQPAQAVNGKPPVTLAAKVLDIGSGLNPESIKVILDDREVNAVYDATRNLVIYQTKGTGKVVDPPLQDGIHTISITASDWKGNAETKVWSFRVDNSLAPPSSRETPAPPRPGITAPGGQNAPRGQGNNTNRPGRRGNRRGNTPPNNPPGGTPPPPPGGNP